MTGLGIPSFKKAVQAIVTITEAFQPYVGRMNKLEEWKNSMYQDYLSVDFANRYFSIPILSAGEHELELSQEEDPLGLLAEMRSNSLIHTEDNVVKYLELQTKSNGSNR